MGFKGWQTSPEFFAALHAEFAFTLDAAASHENALLDRYCTERGYFDKAELMTRSPIESYTTSQGFFEEVRIATPTRPEDGLSLPWYDKRVFCNPPYDASIPLWIDKAYEAELCVMLLPPSVDTEWFHALADNFFPDDAEAYRHERWGHQWLGMGTATFGMHLMRGRLKFWQGGKPGPAPRAGNMIVVWS